MMAVPFPDRQNQDMEGNPYISGLAVSMSTWQFVTVHYYKYTRPAGHHMSQINYSNQSSRYSFVYDTLPALA
jgi:hypothetical protein